METKDKELKVLGRMLSERNILIDYLLPCIDFVEEDENV